MIEYRVRPVGRFIVTRFEHSDAKCAGSTGCGEFQSQDLASTVAHALAASEPGATCSTNILPADAPAADLMRNIAEQFAGSAIDGLVILQDARDGEVSVFGLGKQNETDPRTLFRLGAEKMRELGVL